MRLGRTTVGIMQGLSLRDEDSVGLGWCKRWPIRQDTALLYTVRPALCVSIPHVRQKSEKNKWCLKQLQVFFSTDEYLTITESKRFPHFFVLFSHSVDSKIFETQGFVEILKATEKKQLKNFLSQYIIIKNCKHQ